MKRKDQWAQDYGWNCTNWTRDECDSHETAFLAGFEFARSMILSLFESDGGNGYVYTIKNLGEEEIKE